MPRRPLVFVTALLALAACSKAPAPIPGEHPLTKLTERVYVLHGPNELPNKGNQGFMNNPGFVVTNKGVVVIDPGSSQRVGELVLARIAGVTKAPVIAVFNTHFHGDHWLGNDAIRRAFPEAVFYAHPQMMARARTEGANWIALFTDLTGGTVGATEPLVPNAEINDGETLALGGLHFRAYHTGKAHTDGDLMVEVVEEKVMFLGDNSLVDRIGRMDDGDFKGNVAALEAALKTPAQHFVPGHGPSNGRAVAEGYRDYLNGVYAAVKKYREQGLADFEMKPKVAEELKRFAAWKDFEDQLGRHVSLAFLQAEAEAF